MLVDRLKELCKKKGVSFAEFERESGVGERTAARWDTNAPNINKVIQAAEYFGITVSELLGEKEIPASQEASEDDAEFLNLYHRASPVIQAVVQRILTEAESLDVAPGDDAKG